MFKDYYKILNVTRYASELEIKAGYRTMSLKWHPDKNPGIDTVGKMQDINEAYAILKDEGKRLRYNREYDKYFCQFAQTTSEQTEEAADDCYEYDYEVKDEALRDDIAKARQYAKELVSEFLNSFRDATHRAAKAAWNETKWAIFGAIILTIIINVVILIALSSKS